MNIFNNDYAHYAHEVFQETQYSIFAWSGIFWFVLKTRMKLSNITDKLLSLIQPLNTIFNMSHARFVKAAFDLQLLIKQSIYLTHFIPFWYTNTPYFSFILHIYKPLKKFTVMQSFLLAYAKGSGQKLSDWIQSCLLAQR